MLKNLLNKSFLAVSSLPVNNKGGVILQFARALPHFVDKPKPGEFSMILMDNFFFIFINSQFITLTTGDKHQQYRRQVHYPEDGKYTIKPLDNTHLAGRDLKTGRVIANGIGGGIKHKFHWIKYNRDGPAEGPPQV